MLFKVLLKVIYLKNLLWYNQFINFLLGGVFYGGTKVKNKRDSC